MRELSEIDTAWCKYQCIRKGLESALGDTESNVEINEHINTFKLFMRDHASCLPSNLLKQVQQYYRDVLDLFHSKVGCGNNFKFSRRSRNEKPLNRVVMSDQTVCQTSFCTENSSNESFKYDSNSRLRRYSHKLDQMVIDLDDNVQQHTYLNFNGNTHAQNGGFKLKSESNRIILVKSSFTLNTATFSELNNVRIVIINSVDHSILIENAVNCMFMVECQQLRLRNCHNCQMYVSITAANPSGGSIVLESSSLCYFGNKVPIISKFEDKKFVCSLSDYIEKQLLISNKNDKFNLSVVNDFDWVSCNGESPNVLPIEKCSSCVVVVYLDTSVSDSVKFIEITS